MTHSTTVVARDHRRSHPDRHRVIAYHQSHRDDEGVVDLSPFGDTAPMTHLIVSAVHIIDDGTIVLNDHADGDPYHDQLWQQVTGLQQRGVRILAMVGGWAPGTTEKLDGPPMERYYPPLRDFLTAHGFDGIDIDVEQDMSLDGVIALIDRLRTDFGPAFEIILAPVASALWGGANLSGFDYEELYRRRGDTIDFLNVQHYSGFGSPATIADHQRIIDRGVIPVHKLVLGMLGHPDDAQGFIGPDRVAQTVTELSRRHPDFAGVDVWELFRALPGGRADPTRWAHLMADAMAAGADPSVSMINKTPAWFDQAKLGIFVHWGIYAVQGVDESWSFFNDTIAYDDYMAQLGEFGAERFDADAWAEEFVRAGARYAVLTTKHHDGVVLWPSEEASPRVPPVADGPDGGRDLVAQWCDALREHDLHVGLYYSHLDWTHPDYASVRPLGMDDAERGNRFAVPAAGAEDPAAWRRFQTFHRAQIAELITSYHPEMLWFDGDWERDPEQWQMGELRAAIGEWDAKVVCNGRMLGAGDYATPEQGVPVVPPSGPWELCLTLNNSWGWQPDDHAVKPLGRLVRILVETVAGGGNLLLGIGPRPDGTLAAEHVDRLRELGAWVDRHERAIRPTRRGLPAGCFAGPTTVSLDGLRVYLFCFDIPRTELVVRGLGPEIIAARVVATGQDLPYERVGGHLDNAGWDFVSIDGASSPELIDPVCTVVELELGSELTVRLGHTRD
ncbi:MAG: alpha-L-fucosidase [Propionibacteriales bacterium]|nr:alpha-L-fucosidase [Propionibacteriales bacterium]